MKGTLRICWLAVLLVFTAGCSTYKLAALPGIETDTGQVVNGEAEVKVRDLVRITLMDGSVLKGQILAISADRLTLKPKQIGRARTPEPQPVMIGRKEIQSIEKFHASAADPVLAIGVVAVGVFTVAAATYSQQ